MSVIHTIANGVLISVLAAAILKIPSLVRSLRNTKSTMLGDWTVYLLIDAITSLTEKPTETDMHVRRAQNAVLHVKRSLLGGYNVVYEDEQFTFVGKGYYNLQYFCLDLESKEDKSTSHHRYSCTHVDQNGLCYGLWLSLGNGGNVASGPVIIQKWEKEKPTELTDEQVVRILDRLYEFNETQKFVRINVNV